MGDRVVLRGVALALLAWSAACPCRATPVIRVVGASAAGASLLRDGGFQATGRGGWQPYESGFRADPSGGRQGSAAAFCENRTPSESRGASQTITLSRSRVAPLVVRGWSKAEGVTGSRDGNYSLYVDLVYTDGTPLWGQTVGFRPGTHDWERRELVILPQKPVRTATVYCLLRGHAGRAWFDDVSLTEVSAGGGTVLYQGVPVQVSTAAGRPTGPTRVVASRDGLSIGVRDSAVTSVRVDGRELASPSPSGFLVRDVAAGSDFHSFRQGVCRDLGLKLSASYQGSRDHITVSGRLSDTTGKDRAVTLVFALPLEAVGWQWGDDLRSERRIAGQEEFTNTVAVQCGSTGTLSLYPLEAVYGQRAGVALALDMGRPAQYRLAYHAGLKQLLIAYDFGLVKESERFPGAAEFRFVLYRFDPEWGFRSALRKLTRIFPAYFAVRSKDQGLWMPFTDISTVQGWQDFGFRYHEGTNNVPFDDTAGILSFRYTEPMTWWMPMAKGIPRTVPEAVRVREETARGSDESRRRMAQALATAGMYDEEGRPSLQFLDTPWCDGAVWSLNPNPHLPGPLNAATVYWNPTLRHQLYGPEAKGRQDGEYLDSLEGYVTADLNFRREHFRHTTVPLTFDTASKRPALYKGLAVYEFTRWLSEDVHRMGKLMFANGVPYRFTFLCPWLDVMGTETDWVREGRYSPASDAQMSLWRAMSGSKPYVLLMNTNYDVFSPEMVERYFQRSLFYGMYPGMFSHNAAENPYWQNPKWYNRDRPLFRKYVPIIKRMAESGWQPVTGARCSNPRVYVERFGPDRGGAVTITLLNDTNEPQSGDLILDLRTLGIPRAPQVREMISSRTFSLSGNRLAIRLAPQEVWAVQLAP